MKRQSGYSLNPYQLREYDPYRPREISSPKKPASVRAKRSTKAAKNPKGHK